MNALRLENVHAGPDKTTVLNGITARFGPGLTGLVGPNGAGKTTLLRVCMGLIKPQSGTLYVGESPLDTLNLKQRARHIAYLPQNGPVHWAMGVRDLVGLGRFSSTTSKEEDHAAAARAMKECVIEGFADRPITTLSGGERSRVLLARALCAQTPVLLVDEPCTALDPAQQHRTMGVLRARAKTGSSVLCVLHDLPLAARYCDRLVFLSAGKIIEDGTPEAVLTSTSFTDTYGLVFDKRGYLVDDPI